MTNAEYFFKNGNDDIDYFADKWIESDTNLIDFLKQKYKVGLSND